MIYSKGGKSHVCAARKLSGNLAPRRQYSNREKSLVLSLVDKKMKEEGLSLARAATELCVPLSSVCRWRADAKLPNLSTDSSDVADKAQNHKGPECFLDDIKEELMKFIAQSGATGVFL
jgi:hypothetical protein